MLSITKENYSAYILGSTFFATGGGIPPTQHAAMFCDLLRKSPRLMVQPCIAFHPDDQLVSLYGIGDPSQVTRSFEACALRALREYEKHCYIHIAGMIPGEIGAEAVAFQAAVQLEIPVVDSDLVGGRAAPEVHMDVFSVFGRAITPALVMDTDGTSFFFSDSLSGKEVEERARTFLSVHSSNGVLVGYAISAMEYRKVGMRGTLSRALAVGEALESNNFESAFGICDGSIVARERLNKVDLKSDGGFLKGALTFDNHIIRVKNEHIALEKKGTVLVSAPDLIIVMTIGGVPIHNAEVSRFIGQSLLIATVPAQGYWRNTKNQALWESAFV